MGGRGARGGGLTLGGRYTAALALDHEIEIGGGARMPEYVDHVIGALQRRGWTPADARAQLDRRGWMVLLPVVSLALPPDAVAEDLRRHTRCEICGHPLHAITGDVAWDVLGAERQIRNLPHTAACSCGYARPLVPQVWVAAAEAYFRRHPGEHDVDAADLARG